VPSSLAPSAVITPSPLPSVSGTVGHDDPALTLAGPVVTLGGLQELAQKIGTDGAAVVVVDQKSDLSLSGYARPGVSDQWRNTIRALAADRLTVVVSKAIPTGTAGALLYALATARVIADGATVSQLPSMLTAGQAPACDSGLCASLTSAAITVDNSAPPAKLGYPVVLPAPAAGGQSTWLLVALILVAIAAVWFAVGRRIAARLGGRPSVPGSSTPSGFSTPPRPGTATRPAIPRPSTATDVWPPTASTPRSPRPEPRLGPGEGIVRTVMDPEGYVEIDGVLYPATWRGSRSMPRPGVVVNVEERNGELAVVDRGPGRAGRG
jgi:hypothetical protein